MGMMFKGGVKPAHHGMQPGSHPGGVLSALVQLCHFCVSYNMMSLVSVLTTSRGAQAVDCHLLIGAPQLFRDRCARRVRNRYSGI
jgi:hypothetical protein